MTAHLVTLSRNEAETLAMKATRGAGYTWGLAEEAGFATGWLAATGIDATPALLHLLAQRQGLATGLGRPQPQAGHWRATGGLPLCPLTLGAALLDNALRPDGPFTRPTRLENLDSPLLLLPFLARAAQMRQQAVAVDWQGGTLHIAATGAFDRQAVAGWGAGQTLDITIHPATDTETPPATAPAIQGYAADVLKGLDALALRTTVPATEASRGGAGSATPDTD